MPGRRSTAAAMAAAWSPRTEMTTGSPAPAGKCSASTFSPTTESGVPGERLGLGEPVAFSLTTSERQDAEEQGGGDPHGRGRAAMRSPPGPEAAGVGSAEPYGGTRGQKTQRPVITSSAGSSVIMASRPTATPIAATGPRPGWSSTRRASRQSIPTITVAALAMMAGPARRSASAIASCRSSCRRSSSR